MSDITNWSLRDTLAAIDSKQTNVDEVKQAYLKRIEQYNSDLNAYLQVNSEVDGLPMAVKEVISTKGLVANAASKILENYYPPFDATIISKLKVQGFGVVGMANMDEFAMGSSGENSAYGVTKNPWDKSRVPGGSSSGSAVAVAADMALFSLGTDTGGSIRQPASLTGVVGVKPSYGRVSRYGVMAMASSLDQPGPFTKTVADARLVTSWMSGADGLDSNCSLSEWQNVSKFKDSVKGLKIGLPKQYFAEGLDASVKEVIMKAVDEYQKMGAEIVEIDLPNTEYAIAVYYIVMASEVSSNLGRFSGIRYGGSRELFGAEVKRRIMLGTFALSTGYFDDYFIKAAKVRTLIKQDFDRAFEKCDVILGPVSPTTAWKIGEKIDDPLKMYLSDAYTIPASLAGMPGISIPCGFVDGLPVGLQILAPYMAESVMFDVADHYEKSTDWRKERPAMQVARGV